MSWSSSIESINIESWTENKLIMIFIIVYMKLKWNGCQSTIALYIIFCKQILNGKEKFDCYQLQDMVLMVSVRQCYFDLYSTMSIQVMEPLNGLQHHSVEFHSLFLEKLSMMRPMNYYILQWDKFRLWWASQDWHHCGTDQPQQ